MQGTIQQAKPSKSGKTLGVLINDTWYSTKNWELQGMQGQDITFEPSQSEFNGQIMHWLNDYVPVGASNTPSAQAFDQAHAANQGDRVNAAPPHQGTTATASNASGIDLNASIVAQALTKSVTCANAQEAWQCYTYLYKQALNWNPDAEPFDDDIPDFP